MNNKMIKGSVAGATGIVLLVGGFGTYALWSDSATLPGSSVSSGELTIMSNDDVVWDDLSTPLAAADWEPGDSTADPVVPSDLLVPGDVVTRTETFAVTGTGKNLTGTISLSGGAVSDGAFTSTGGQAGDLLNVSLAVTESNVTIVPNGATADPNDFIFNAPFGTGTLTTVVTYDFSEDAEDTDAQKATASMAATTITIAQN